ncbi:MAG: pentapeptide repeat-containing protein [Aphanizomenon sp.]
MLVIAFSVFSGVLFLNPSPSYAYSRNLGSVDYSGRNLSRQDFSDANLSGAYLIGADLSGADLTEADLTGARLSGARLSGADLIGARLSGAIADSETIFPDGFDPVDAGVEFRD